MDSAAIQNTVAKLVKQIERHGRLGAVLLSTDNNLLILLPWPDNDCGADLDDMSEHEALPILDETFAKFGYRRFVAENRACCPVCGEIVESSALVEKSRCSCGNLAIAGSWKSVVCECELPCDSIVTHGWAQEGNLEEVAAHISKDKLSISAIRERMLAQEVPHQYETLGIHNGTNTRIRTKGRTRFEAAQAALLTCPDLSIRQIIDPSLPGNRESLFVALSVNEAAKRRALSSVLDEWEERTISLVDTAANKHELGVIIAFARSHLHGEAKRKRDTLSV